MGGRRARVNTCLLLRPRPREVNEKIPVRLAKLEVEQMSTNQKIKEVDLEMDIQKRVRNIQLLSKSAKFEDADCNVSLFDIDVPFEPFTKSPSDVIPFSIFACWNLLRESGFSERAFDRIVSTAMNRLASGETGLRPLDADTLTGFMNFWNSVRGIAVEPQITISPKGNIQVEWVKDCKNFMVMEFQPNYDVFISLWKDDQPLEGIRSRETLPELIRVFDAMDENPLRWSNAA